MNPQYRHPTPTPMNSRARPLLSLLLALAALALSWAVALPARAQLPKFKPGDRVECDKAKINQWEKGTVMPYLKYDDTSGSHYRVRLDTQANSGMYMEGIGCAADKMRLLAGAPAYQPTATSVAVGKATVGADNTLSADRPILACPTEQKPARNGSAPDPETLKKVLRCGIGEKPAPKGYDGAVTVEIASLQVGASRPWDRLLDKNGGTPGTTVVYPVKVKYSVKSFYRSVTRIEDDWIVIYNCFVNGFGEWQYGSAETVKRPDLKNVPR